MRKIKTMLLKNLGNLAVLMAFISVYTGHPHCMIIIHQPDIPEELMNMSRENDARSLKWND